MKNIRLLLLTTIALSPGMFMYGQASDASIMIDKENRHAIMITIDQPEKITSDALEQRLERSGLKKKTRRGVARYKEVTLSEISPDQVDIYTKVDKGPNNSSIVYMAVSKGYDNFTNSTDDSIINQNVKAYLESLVMYTDYHSADVGITNQINDLNKEEKVYQKLLDEQKKLQKQKSDIENRLKEIQHEINVKSEEINKRKAAVETARVNRGNINDQ